ncbi:helix-turn-helix domain-containing protein [Roseibium sp. MMSF_3412]|uniref:helix-turn-helix domain-containing protein n=1 Tax=Roseibium sp. MMSF_3412 TaxID=3046712 RepID=UPI00273EB3C7|nr:helix-turn-helix domain-containing protein [Roseibium sp. MMSF_3412]
MNSVWFPSSARDGQHECVTYLELNDCHSQLDLLLDNHKSIQLTPGRFKGRLLAMQTGAASIFVENYNRALEVELLLPDGDFTFVAAISGLTEDVAFGGVTTTTDWVLVGPPKAEHHTVLPPDCLSVVAKVEMNALLSHPAILPEVADWFSSVRERPVLVSSFLLAERFRSGALAVLESMVSGRAKAIREAVDQAFILDLVIGFNLEWLRQNSYVTHKPSKARERFLLARRLLLGVREDVGKRFKSSIRDFGSQRLFELAFSNQVNMGPLAYSRLARLQNARQKLLDKTFEQESIGDIAAEEGFWDWSRFTSYYNRQFCELPSETRSRLLEDARGSCRA